MGKQTRKYRYDFRGGNLIPLTAANVGSTWSKADTSAAGAPTLLPLAGGGQRLLLAADVEVENLCLYMGDNLPFDIDEIISAWFIVRKIAALDATSQIAWGLCSARNDAIDSIAEQACFRCIGGEDVVVETDDGTNNNDDVATGLTLAATWKRFSIDFASRNFDQSAPSVSLGRKSNIEFYGANDNGSQRRVASGTRFDMSNYAGGLQFFFQLQKTADANTDNFDVLECGIEVNLPDFS